jgi:hypothetical protein
MNIVFVNLTKKKRAQKILDLVTGKDVAKTQGEEDQVRSFSNLLGESKIDPKSEDALEFVYERLGGLVRTEAEQKAADLRKEEAQKKGRKRMIE